MRHARRPCVTVAIDSVSFHSPVHVGELLALTASLTFVGRTSIEVRVQVHAENPISGVITHTNSAYFVFVALDEADEALRVLRRGVEERDEEMMYLKVDPRYDPIRADARFAEVLALLDLDRDR